MAKKLELSWIGALKQWRKRRKVGEKTKTWYLGTGTGKGDQASYQRALKKWKAIEAGLNVVDAQAEASEFSEKYRQAYSHLPPYVPSDVVSDPAPDFDIDAASARNRRQNFIPTGKPEAPTKTLAELVDEYLAAQQRRMEHGQRFPNAPREDRISPIRFISYRYNARLMAKVWGTTAVPSNEAETYAAMKRFRDTQQDLLTAGKLASGTFNERIKTMRHFIKWCFDNYHLAVLPRNLKKLVSMYKVESSARALDLPLVRKIWAAANGRLKTWIALGCNCGFYSVDCAHLTAEMIQGEYLVLDRHKTGVPTRFKLWPVTKKLLAQHANKTGLAFTDEKGQNLWMIDVEKGVRKCKIDNQLTMLKSDLKITKVSFSNFRDTSSTKIESLDPTLTDVFDGHADTRMAKFYIDHGKLDKNALFARLDAATDALEKWYGLKLEA